MPAGFSPLRTLAVVGVVVLTAFLVGRLNPGRRRQLKHLVLPALAYLLVLALGRVVVAMDPVVWGPRLLWLALVLVPLRGVTPSTLWHAFGVHGGDQLLPAQMGDLLLLCAPPLALLGFCVMERRYLLVLLHDVLIQLPPGMSKFFFLWQVFSPVLPLAIWAAFMRQPLFSDLPAWPGVAIVMTICFLANAPPLTYAYWRILPLQGAAHYFEGGVILWSASAF